MRRKISYLLKGATAVSALGGVILSLISARSHGYSHWSKRLMYFTAQSNLWIGLTALALLFIPFFHGKNAEKVKRSLYLLKFVFTVSITTTCVVFCFLLAPFADESYHVWAFSSFLTHVFAPLFAIADFFVDEYKIPLRKGQAFLALLPPLFYFAPTYLMSALNVDFGRGVAYPYYFLDFRSPVGFFGFAKTGIFMGVVYWLALLGGIMLGIAALYIKLYNGKNEADKKASTPR